MNHDNILAHLEVSFNCLANSNLINIPKMELEILFLELRALN